jgi:hypothetical protein
LTYPPQPVARCFRITALRADGSGAPTVTCPAP